MTAAGTFRGSGLPGTDVPVRSMLRTADVDEARAFCRTLYYGPLHAEPIGDRRTFLFEGKAVSIGPITVGEICYGTDMRITTTDLETAYHVLAPVAGTLESRHRGTVVRADPTRATVFRPTGDIEPFWSGGCRVFSVKVDRAALERELDAALDRQLVTPLPLGASFDLAGGPGRTWAALVRLLHAELVEPDGLGSLPRMAARWRDLVISGLALSVEHPYGEE